MKHRVFITLLIALSLTLPGCGPEGKAKLSTVEAASLSSQSGCQNCCDKLLELLKEQIAQSKKTNCLLEDVKFSLDELRSANNTNTLIISGKLDELKTAVEKLKIGSGNQQYIYKVYTSPVYPGGNSVVFNLQEGEGILSIHTWDKADGGTGNIIRVEEIAPDGSVAAVRIEYPLDVMWGWARSYLPISRYPIFPKQGNHLRITAQKVTGGEVIYIGVLTGKPY